MSELAPELEDLAQCFVNDLALAVWKECPQRVDCGYVDVSLSDTGSIEDEGGRTSQIGFVDLDCRSDLCPYVSPGNWRDLGEKVMKSTLQEFSAEDPEVKMAIEGVRIGDFFV